MCLGSEMTDVNAAPEGDVPAGAELAAFVRTPFGAQCVRVGLAALASSIGALTICALLPSQATSSTPPPTQQARKSEPAGQVGASIDVAKVWAEERALLHAVNNPALRVPPADAWSPAGGVSVLLATRFPSAGNVQLEEIKAAVPLPPRAPVARLASIRRQTVGARAPAQATEQNGLQLASLPPQTETPAPNTFNFFRQLFADPDEAALEMLADHPKTALYDIERRVVYLPNGEKLEAHSGFGKYMDDPTSVDRKNLGVTPPNVYAVTFREKPFHGVRALRLTPIGKGNMYGRDGMLAHSYLLDQAGSSNGCISVKDYDKLLQAYENGAFQRFIVVPRIDERAPALVASLRPGGVSGGKFSALNPSP
jgi:hypothetical protein